MTLATVAASSWWSQHETHLLVLGGPTLAMAFVATLADLRARRAGIRARRSTTERRRIPVAGRLAIVFSVAAALVHAEVCPEHFREAFIYGLFFLCAAAAQLGWVVITLARPRRWLVFGGLGGNLAVVLLWAWTRTLGDFTGPERGQTEPVGLWDVVATACEIGVVVCTLLWIRQLRIGRLGAGQPAARRHRALSV